jgi:WD40 repeat protein
MTAGWDGTCKFWDVTTGNLARVIDVPPHCEGATFAPDGRTFAILCEDDAMIHDTRSGQRLHLLTGHQNTAECLAFSPDGRWLATGSHDRTIRIWDVSTGDVEHVMPTHQSKIRSLAFSPDGQTIASGDKEGRIAFTHVSTGRFLFERQVADGDVDSLAFSPSGDALVFVNESSQALLLNMNPRF